MIKSQSNHAEATMRTDTPIKNEHYRISDTLYIAKEELDFETYSTNYLQVTWKNDEEYEP